MKGLVIVEYLKFLEVEYDYNLVDEVIESSDLPDGGAFTTVGSYHFSQMLDLVSNTSKVTGRTIDELFFEFGKFIFQAFVMGHAQFFSSAHSSFDIFRLLDSYIHPEVRKLYPEAELPKFTVEREDGHEMILVYQSKRKMSSLAAGLIDACMMHYDEDGSVIKHNIDNDGEIVRFRIKKG
jgi:hypothetical protein